MWESPTEMVAAVLHEHTDFHMAPTFHFFPLFLTSPFWNCSQRLPVIFSLSPHALITCLMTRIEIAQKPEGWFASVAKLGVVTPINNSLVSLLPSPHPPI